MGGPRNVSTAHHTRMLPWAASEQGFTVRFAGCNNLHSSTQLALLYKLPVLLMANGELFVSLHKGQETTQTQHKTAPLLEEYESQAVPIFKRAVLKILYLVWPLNWKTKWIWSKQKVRGFYSSLWPMFSSVCCQGIYFRSQPYIQGKNYEKG